MKAPCFAGVLLLVATAGAAQDGMTLKGVTLGTDIDAVTADLLAEGWTQIDMEGRGDGVIYDPATKTISEGMPIGHLVAGEAWSPPLIQQRGFEKGPEVLDIVADVRGPVQEITYVMDYPDVGPFGDYDAAFRALSDRYDGRQTCGSSDTAIHRLVWNLDRSLKEFTGSERNCYTDEALMSETIWAALTGLAPSITLPQISVTAWFSTHKLGGDVVLDDISITLQDIDAIVQTLSAGYEAVKSAHPVAKVAPDF